MHFLDFREPVSAWTHCVWMFLAIPGTILLWQRSRGNLPKQLSLLVFGLSLICCYAGSTLFHAVHQAQRVQFCHTLDHIGIYLLIAGSYTPAAFVLLQGGWRWVALGLSWSLAICGILMRVVAREIPPFLSTGLYLTLGWGGILFYFEMARILSHRALRPLVLGGVLYSVGALINLANWPALNPGIFGAHELFHVFVMVGSLTHFYFMLEFIVPFERPAGVALEEAEGVLVAIPVETEGDAYRLAS